MNKIPLTQILVVDRLRVDKGDIDSMADSLRRVGQIHPILLSVLDNPVDGKTHRLVAGERRYLGATKLGWTEIGFTTRDQLTPEELQELELEENIRRKSMTWQEHTLAIASIHKLKCQRAWSSGEEWGQQQTGEMFGLTNARVSVITMLARELKENPTSPCWQAASAKDAVDILCKKALAIVEPELAKRSALPTGATKEQAREVEEAISIVDSILSSPDLLENERQRYYSNPHNPPDSFDTYWKEKQEKVELLRNKVFISNRFLRVDCLEYLKGSPNTFNHIITDPPYAINMDMLEQPNTGMENIESVRAEHDEEENWQLLQLFIPLAYDALKDKGTLILWCDAELFQDLHYWCDKAGFSVQRWPFVWLKSDFHSNQAAQYNMTKCTEFALVARKGGALLTRNDIPNFVIAPFADEMTKQMSHPFAKPFAVWKHLIEAVSLPGDLILEPFMGEGSGVLSMLKLGRNVVGLEKVAAHHAKAMEQIKKFYLSQNSKALFV